MAEVATDRLRLRPTEVGWPLDEMWATGALLEPADDIDHDEDLEDGGHTPMEEQHSTTQHNTTQHSTAKQSR